MPTVCVAPVRSHCKPKTSSLSCADAAPAARAIAPAAMVAVRQLVLFDIVFPPWVSCCRYSIRKWPDAEVVADVAPQAVETLRLHHQKEDDEAAEQDEPGAGDDARQLAGDVLVAYGDEGAADAAPDQVERRQRGEDREEQQEIVELPLGLHVIAHKGGPRHVDGSLRSAGDGRRVVDDPLDDELTRQGG